MSQDDKALASPAPAATTVDAAGVCAIERRAVAERCAVGRCAYALREALDLPRDENGDEYRTWEAALDVVRSRLAHAAPAADASDEEMVEDYNDAICRDERDDHGPPGSGTTTELRASARAALLSTLATLRERAEQESANAAESEALCDDWKARTDGAEARAAAYCAALARVQAIGCMACHGAPVTNPDGSTQPCAICNAQPKPRTKACDECGIERGIDPVTKDFWPCPECSKRWRGPAISPRGVHG